MDENTTNFGNNPFQILDSAKFPKWKGNSCKATGSDQKFHATDCNARKQEDTEFASENAIFLRAMANMPKLDRAYPKGFISLNEQCNLSSHAKKMKKNKIRKNKKNDCENSPAPEQKKTEDIDEYNFMMAMRNVHPLGGKGRKIPPFIATHATLARKEPGFEDLIAEKLQFSMQYSDEYMEGHVVGLDELTMNRLRNGQMSPEANLDLHGLNAVQAFEALRNFMRQSWFKSLRLVLIVTGRGRNSPEGLGILRHKMQEWLTQEPFKRIVLAYCTAKPYDGGPGSIYVLLRKYRKKGRIYWERLPSDSDLF